MEPRETDNTLVPIPEKPLAAAFADAVAAVVDIVDAHHREGIKEPMQIPYLLAECVLQLARDTELFHVLGVYIARQGLRLVLLLNADMAEEEPGKQQLEERDKLRDDLIELEESMSLWVSDLGTEDEYERRCQEIRRQYNRFFATRFYFDNSQNLFIESTFEKLLAYDHRSLDFDGLQQRPGAIVGVEVEGSPTPSSSAGNSQSPDSRRKNFAETRARQDPHQQLNELIKNYFGDTRKVLKVEYKQTGHIKYAQRWKCTIFLEDAPIGESRDAPSQKAAKIEAAKRALRWLEERGYPRV